MIIDYHSLDNEIFEILSKCSTMNVAFGSDQKVITKNLKCLLHHRKLYLKGDGDLAPDVAKTYHPNVAICVRNIQMEGVARIKNELDNELEYEIINHKLNGSSDDICKAMSGQMVIEVEPVTIALWKYEDGQTYRDCLDLSNKIAYRELCDAAI